MMGHSICDKRTWSFMWNVMLLVEIHLIFFVMHQPRVGLSPPMGESTFDNAGCVECGRDFVYAYHGVILSLGRNHEMP